jgi:hypothetical protein
MRSLYARPHRRSIEEPASIHDIPQQVLGKTLIIPLPRRDLVAASSACLARRPVAQQLLHYRLKIICSSLKSVLCGYR